MIFDTLAAMASYDNNKKFDFAATRAQCKTAMTTRHNNGKLPLTESTITVDSHTPKTADDATKFSYFVKGILDKSAYSTISSNIEAYL